MDSRTSVTMSACSNFEIECTINPRNFKKNTYLSSSVPMSFANLSAIFLLQI